MFFERFISAGRVDQAELRFGDESSAVLPVSEKVKVLTDDGAELEKYIHQVLPGDWVLLEPGTTLGDVICETLD